MECVVVVVCMLATGSRKQLKAAFIPKTSHSKSLGSHKLKLCRAEISVDSQRFQNLCESKKTFAEALCPTTEQVQVEYRWTDHSEWWTWARKCYFRHFQFHNLGRSISSLLMLGKVTNESVTVPDVYAIMHHRDKKSEFCGRCTSRYYVAPTQKHKQGLSENARLPCCVAVH